MISFKNAIKSNNLKQLSKISKVDLHNHAACSCTKEWLIKNNINLSNDEVTDIYSLNNFCKKHINPIHYTQNGLTILLNGNFDNCIKTGVKIVGASIDYKICIKVFNNNINDYINFLKSFERNNLIILWDLGISRDTYEDNHHKIIVELLKTKYFNGLDLYGVEDPNSNYKYVDYYKIANELEMVTKVHAGEQLNYDYIKKCIYDFNPKQIQHGINIINDIDTMNLAKKKKIIFNVCPTSNIILGYVKNYKNR